MNHDEKRLVRIAQKNGAIVEPGGNHLNVWHDGELVFSLSKGSNKNGHLKSMLKVWKRKGWL